MAIHRIRPAALSALLKRPGKHADGGGLYLQVPKSGTGASWVYQYSLRGRVRWMSIGPAVTFSIAEAREARHEARRLRDRGIDPLEARGGARAIHKPAAEAAGETFADCVVGYLADKAPYWRGGLTGREAKAYRATLLKSTLAPLPVATITTPQVKEALASMKAATANKVLTRTAAILDWAKVAGKRSGDNPARLPKNERQHIVPAKPPPVHLAAMPWAEVPAFMRELRADCSAAARALVWTILTAGRTGETLHAKWSEIDGDSRIIPAERMKRSKAHEVPLAPEAAALLGGRKADGAYLFPSVAGGAMAHAAMSGHMLRLRPKYKVHGFRSTFTDWAAEHGYPSELREMALAHSVGDDTEKAYRRTTLVNKRREMMAAWAAFALGGAPA